MHSNERGFALVVSMLILLVMTLLGLVLMTGAVLNRSLAGSDQRMRQSLNIAEAGVGEAEARIAHQETLMPLNDPNAVCQVFNTVAGSVPVLTGDSTALATGQAAGSFLNYSTPTRGPDVLTITWKKDPTGTKVMRYDATANPTLNTLSGIPVYTITSTGRVGNARRTVVAEVIQKPFTANVKAALAANIPIGALGNSVVCGYDHLITTPNNDGHKGRTNPAPIPPNDPDYCQDNEDVSKPPLPAIWSSGTVDPSNNADCFGAGVPAYVQNQTGFYSGPWDAFGMSQSDFWGFVGAPTASPPNYNGVYYVDNNGVTQDKSADVKLTSVTGEGFLYIDGNLHISSNFSYVGLLYIEGDFDINGNAWVLGGIIVNGVTNIKANGGMTLLYSGDAINQSVTKYAGQFVTLNWREK
ncbi:MAG TPA: pilus assembly PilX N-terminal domain-containing protein [Candidatus Eisenbacteria bacterium]